MDAALNDQADGWYGAGKASLGPGGDFTTSPELGPLFGACVASWVAEQWERLQCPSSFAVVEFGAGKGSLARSLLDTLREEWSATYEALRLVAVDRSSSMRGHCQSALEPHADRVQVRDAILFEEVTGPSVIVSNEFVDALPVNVARVLDGRLEELHVTLDSDRQFAGVWSKPSTDRIEAYASLFHPQIANGATFMFEAPLDAWDWISAMVADDSVTSILTFDYGFAGVRAGEPQRPKGSIRAMRARQPVADIVGSLFEADLTADVNFDLFTSVAVASGWTADQVVSQADWLIRHGVLERIAGSERATVAERLAAKALITPGGLGERLKVLELARNCNRRTSRGDVTDKAGRPR